MPTAKSKCLFASRPCGCLSHCMIVDEQTTNKDLADFWSKAAKRDVTAREIQVGEELPGWECDKHHAQRVSRKAKLLET